ncbi:MULTISPECIES: DUF6941 family protein [Bacillus]|nr:MULTISPECIES: hypothetical protein [Bacillus]UIN47053.1 hypothetical protein LXN06_04830 [Bacillus licheniformis]MCJ8223363.1 hypothetical protein [Bacillus paralicheniformis]MCY7800790.1 hypothetical protein [Bacillus haynesii]MCY8576811.1 hypothetical protein [Bacillus haynesii]MCY9147518.1 hypothetical protein [Bacillus haynesii]
MFKIGYVVICENVYNDGNQFIIKNPYSIISPVNIPGNFSFNLAFSMMKILETERSEEVAQLQIIMKDPDNEVCINTGVLKASPTPRNEREAEHKILIGDASINFSNIVFKKEGFYTLEIIVDGEKQKSIEIPVYIDKTV